MRFLLVGMATWSVSLGAFSVWQADSVRKGVYSEAQAYRGEKVADTTCIGCHGAGFGGGDSGPKLVGEKFLADWQGKSVAELFEWIFEKMPEDAPGTLKKEDVAAVVAYILQINSMPSGKQDLPVDTAVLSRIEMAAGR
jgi:mono/diheme cytochrome c family protein